MDLGRPGQSRFGSTTHHDQLDLIGLEDVGQGHQFFGLPAVGKKQCDVSSSKPSQVAMHRFRGVDEVAGLPEAGKGR